MFQQKQIAVLALSIIIAFLGYWPEKSITSRLNFESILNIYFTKNFLGVVNAISREGKSKAIYYHDLYRSKLARGLVKNKNGTFLPKGKNIYAMVKWFLKSM